MCKLKFYVSLMLLVFILSACSTYQYIAVDSFLDKNDMNEFVYENDSVRINYEFTGQNFSVKYTIFNKLNKPLYINWDNSLVAINDEEYYDAYYDQPINFIAPLSNLNVQSNILINSPIEISASDTLTNMGLQATANDGTWKRYAFSDEISPVFFINILSISYNNDMASPIYLENSFWVSELYQTNTKNNALTNNSNRFYLKKQTKAGSFFSTTALLAIALFLTALGGGE